MAASSGEQAVARLLLGHQLLLVVVLADVVGVDELADVRALRRAVVLRLLAPRALGERLTAVLLDRGDTDGVDALVAIGRIVGQVVADGVAAVVGVVVAFDVVLVEGLGLVQRFVAHELLPTSSRRSAATVSAGGGR